MQGGDKERFCRVMILLGENFGQKASELKMDLFYTGLQKFTIEEIEAGATVVMQTKTISTFPTLAEILQAIEGSPADRAANALRVLELALGGPQKTEDMLFDDSVLPLVIRALGGLDAAVDLYFSKQWDYEKPRILDLYRAYARHRPAVAALVYGTMNVGNRTQQGGDTWIAPPVRVRDTLSVDSSWRMTWEGLPPSEKPAYLASLHPVILGEARAQGLLTEREQKKIGQAAGRTPEERPHG